MKKAKKEYKRLMRENGAAGACKDCRACVERCPQGIDIPEQLKKVRAVMEQGKPITEAFV
jgi:hypothetical protein